MSSDTLPRAPRLSQRFAGFAAAATGHRVTLGELVGTLSERGHALLALFFVVPFLQPIPLPGISTVFGVAAGLVGVQMALGRPPWLPRRLRERTLATSTVLKISRAAQALFSRFERVIKPRGRFLHAHPGMRRLSGVVIAVAGLLLAVPLPVPVSNFLPALSVALVALGSLEEDGLVVALGFVAFAVACAFFVALALLPILGVESLRGLLA